GIRDGLIAPGTRLPATRELARELSVSRGVAVEAYAQLTAEGYLTTRRGAGTVVADASRPAEPPRRLPFPRSIPEDFHPGTPDLAGFPRSAWLRSLRAVTRDAPDVAFGYLDPAGVPQLRVALVQYLARARGVATDTERMLITSGLTQAIA